MLGSFYVYIIINARSQRYIGITSNLSQRLSEHNAGLSSFTSSRGPWKMMWSSKAKSHTDALKLEKLMKKQKGGVGLRKLMMLEGESS